MYFDKKQVRDLLFHGRITNELLEPRNGAIPHLINLLGDFSPSDEIEFNPPDPERPMFIGPRAFDYKSSRPITIYEQAKKALKLIGEKAVPGLIGALAHPNWKIRRNAESVLITLAGGYFVNDPVSGPGKKFVDISLYEVFCSLNFLVDRAESSGDKESIKKTRDEARSCYIEIATAARSNKHRIFVDGEILEGTIRPPKGSGKGGMFRTDMARTVGNSR